MSLSPAMDLNFDTRDCAFSLPRSFVSATLIEPPSFPRPYNFKIHLFWLQGISSVWWPRDSPSKPSKPSKPKYKHIIPPDFHISQRPISLEDPAGLDRLVTGEMSRFPAASSVSMPTVVNALKGSLHLIARLVRRKYRLDVVQRDSQHCS